MRHAADRPELSTYWYMWSVDLLAALICWCCRWWSRQHQSIDAVDCVKMSKLTHEKTLHFSKVRAVKIWFERPSLDNVIQLDDVRWTLPWRSIDPPEECSQTLAYYFSSASDKDTLGRCMEQRERVLMYSSAWNLRPTSVPFVPFLSRCVPCVPFVSGGIFHTRAGTNMRPRVVPVLSLFGFPSVVFVNPRRNSTVSPYPKHCFSRGTKSIINLRRCFLSFAFFFKSGTIHPG